MMGGATGGSLEHKCGCLTIWGWPEIASFRSLWLSRIWKLLKSQTGRD